MIAKLEEWSTKVDPKFIYWMTLSSYPSLDLKHFCQIEIILFFFEFCGQV